MEAKKFFTKGLIEAVTFLIKQCYVWIGNLVLNQNIGIPMGIGPDPFGQTLFFISSNRIDVCTIFNFSLFYRAHNFLLVVLLMIFVLLMIEKNSCLPRETSIQLKWT